MGCTYDVVTVTMKKREHIQLFCQLFSELLKEDFDDEHFEVLVDDIEECDGEFQLQVEGEPLFDFYNDGYQIEYLMCEFLKKVPDAEYVVEYYCTFNNCGDALCVEWKNENRKCIVKRLYGDMAGIYYCPECDANFYEPLCLLEDYDPDIDYICPECGIKLKMNVSKIVQEMSLTEDEEEREILFQKIIMR